MWVQSLLIMAFLTLVGCSEDKSYVPSTEQMPLVNANAAEVSEQASRKSLLKLEIPSLAEWGGLMEVRLSLGDSVDIRATMTNELGDGVANQRLILESAQGNFFTQTEILTDHAGQADSVILATVEGEDMVTVRGAAGVSAQLKVVVNQAMTSAPTDVLEELPGVLSWKTLSKVKYVEDLSQAPQFDKEVQKFEGSEVKVRGFMMPLQNSEKQKHFLISAAPPSCFYCLPTNLEGLMEVNSTNEVEFSFEPIVLKGKLQLLRTDEVGLLYRLNAATVTTIQ